MKDLFAATLLLFSFCSFGQTVGETIDSVTASKMIWVRGPRIDTFHYDKLSPALRKFIDTLICKHIYVAVEPDTISLATGTVSLKIVTDEGQEIVCIKCFYKRKQHVKQMEQAEPWRAWGPFFQKNGGGCFLPNQLPQKDKRLTLEVREQK